MKCPHCGHEEDKVVDSRPSQDGRAIRRRRECLGCSERFTTYEYVEQATLSVLKRDGRREPFDRQKVLHGIKLACNKRPVSGAQMESLVQAVEADVNARGRSEITSSDIGEIVIARLREIDEVAYIRFASVYREFEDINEFLSEMQKLRRVKHKSNGNSGTA